MPEELLTGDSTLGTLNAREQLLGTLAAVDSLLGSLLVSDDLSQSTAAPPPGAGFVRPPSIASLETFGRPTVNRVGGTPQIIAPVGPIASLETFGKPTVNRVGGAPKVLTVVGAIASREAFGRPSVIPVSTLVGGLPLLLGHGG